MDWDENMQILRSIKLKFGPPSCKHAHKYQFSDIQKMFNKMGSVCTLYVYASFKSFQESVT